MEIRIQKIYPNELQKFSESSEYLNFENTPISKKRILSYLHNPRKNDQFPVLYLGFLGEKLIVYRSVLQDQFYVNTNKKLSCIWTSGVWTHPEFRRKGYAKHLLDEVLKDYNGFILSTNLAMETQELMRSQNLVEPFVYVKGHRFYFRLASAEILPPKFPIFHPFKPFLKGLDRLGNFFLDFRKNSHKNVEFSEIQNVEFTRELEEFITKHNQHSLFKRNLEELKWIHDFPWVEERVEDDKLDQKYHFTTSAKRFQTYMKMIKTPQEISGFLCYSIKNEMMKIHYIFTNSEKEMISFSKFLQHEIQENKISTVLMTDERLIKCFQKNAGFIYAKEWEKGYFIGKNLLREFPEIREKEIFMGDGDTIFT